MHRLVISDNEGTTTVVPLVRDEVSIGRKDGNTIRLTERNISRRHAQLQRVNGAYVIKDLDSYNGVMVNGHRVVGQSELQDGDQITIGDYSIMVEGADKIETPTQPEVIEDAPTQVAPIPQPQRPAEAAPARLVVLASPAAGAEFALPDNGMVRIGRAPELEVCVDHRSVSREHAAVSCEGGQYRIIDRDSANGVLVNGESVAEARLARGDVIELGEVLIRFVAPGERYVFDPDEAEQHVRPAGVASRNNALIAIAIVGVALVAAMLILSGGDEKAATPVAVTPEPATAPAAAAADQGAPNAEADQPAPADQVAQAAQGAEGAQPTAADYASLLELCREAVAGGRFAEAMAHANSALRLQPNAPDADACLKTAQLNHNEEQTFVRGKAALESGDVEGAYREFSALGAQSPFRVRPEVASALRAVGDGRLSQARDRLEDDPKRAKEIALSVVSIDAMPDAIVAEAKQLAADARQALVDSRQRSARPRKTTHSSGGKSPMDTASACLARGDNACVIRALSGKARTAQELGLLIETYRAMGNAAQAQRNMKVYVQRFPTAKRADTYRRMLQRQAP